MSMSFGFPKPSQALLELFQLSSIINKISRERSSTPQVNYDVTFGSLLLAFLVGSDPVSRWFIGYSQHIDWTVFLERLDLGMRTVDPDILKSAKRSALGAKTVTEVDDIVQQVQQEHNLPQIDAEQIRMRLNQDLTTDAW